MTDNLPIISLTNDMEDIGVLVQDITPEGNDKLNYVWIDNISIKNSMLGIYFRFARTENNEGIKVTDCRFEDIYCPKCDEILKNGATVTSIC